ncbi:MAG TPA: hypothetical protein VHW09_29515 [Bryobacteraceae bacterium]|jgi:hypothetical protein|nr:hypothetical protein [Bryobacteraceae bacterium]
MDSSTERRPEKVLKTQFLLTGFNQSAGVRTYAFEGIADGKRSHYSVEVQLALIPRYGIRIQDLPLLCREYLQHQVELNDLSASFTFSEGEMRIHSDKLATARSEAEQRKKAPRHLVTPNPGAGWRSTF